MIAVVIMGWLRFWRLTVIIAVVIPRWLGFRRLTGTIAWFRAAVIVPAWNRRCSHSDGVASTLSARVVRIIPICYAGKRCDGGKERCDNRAG